jgi:hypothetical protein
MPAIQWSVYRSGQFGSITQPRTEAFQTEGQFQRFWKELMPNEAYPTGDIKWNEEFLIAVTAGQKTTGGFRVYVDAVERTRPNEISVTWVESVPTGVTPDVMTAPWEIVRVKRTPGVIFFKKEIRRGGGTIVQPPSAPGFITWVHEIEGGGRSAQQLAFGDAAQFRAYWLETFDDRAPTQGIDWSREMVVVLHLGRQSTTGYDVLIESVALEGPVLMVRYVRRVPSPGQRVLQKATSPFTVLRIPRTNLPVRFMSRVWDGQG